MRSEDEQDAAALLPQPIPLFTRQMLRIPAPTVGTLAVSQRDDGLACCASRGSVARAPTCRLAFYRVRARFILSSLWQVPRNLQALMSRVASPPAPGSQFRLPSSLPSRF